MSRHKFLLPCLLTAILILASGAQAQETVNRVVAVVGDEVITAMDLDKAMKQFEDQMDRGPGNELANASPSRVRRLALERLIEDKIFDQEVKRQDLGVSPREVERYIARVKEVNNLSDEAFTAMLSSRGLSMKEYEDRLKEDILKQKLINLEVKSRVVVSDAQVEEYYRAHPDQFQHADEVVIRTIFLSAGPKGGAADAAARQKAADLHDKLGQGADFAQLAKQYSEGPGAEDGGRMGPVKVSDMLPPMRMALGQLQPGQVSEVVDIPGGFVIMQLVERSGQAGQTPLDGVKEQIRSKLEKDAMEARFQEWLKDLRAKIYVKIMD